MSKREPTVAVTEADRKAACAAYDSDVEPLNCVAFAIARARTMAAFDERVRAIYCCNDAGGGIGAIANIANAPFAHIEALFSAEGVELTDDDIRALVLKGWGQ